MKKTIYSKDKTEERELTDKEVRAFARLGDVDAKNYLLEEQLNAAATIAATKAAILAWVKGDYPDA